MFWAKEFGMDWMDIGGMRRQADPWAVLDERWGEMVESFETMRKRFREAFPAEEGAGEECAPEPAPRWHEGAGREHGVRAARRKRLLPEGSWAGEWQVRGLLARGGSAEVYCACHRDTGAAAVLKVLWNDKPHLRERFRREQELLMGNPGPSFPAAYGTGSTGGHPWIALERLEAFDPLPNRDADVARCLLEVAEGAATLHAKGWIHRDIKPANVMRRPSDGRAVLIDFGLAKAFDDGGDASGVLPDDGELSVVDGQVLALGTPGYAAPEQRDGGRMTPATDVYALGMLAARCLGERMPRAWKRIVLKATAARPQFRYGSMAELSRAIRRRHWDGIALVVAGGAFALMGAVLWYWANV